MTDESLREERLKRMRAAAQARFERGTDQGLAVTLNAADYFHNETEETKGSIPLPKPQAKQKPQKAEAAELIAQALGMLNGKHELDPEAVRKIVQEELAKQDQARRIDIVVTQGEERRVIEGAHPAAADVVTRIQALAPVGMGVLLQGPAGSGKTQAAIHAAEALGRKCYVQPGAALVDPILLTGFRDAHGTYTPPPLIQAMSEGAIYVLDELDATIPSVQLALNAIVAQRRALTPEGEVMAVEGFAVLGTANTIGQGANAAYRGRYAQDAAVLDRYTILQVDYVPELEARLCGHDAALKRIRSVRKAVDELALPYVVGMRASIAVGALARAGIDLESAFDEAVWHKMNRQDREAVRGRL